MKLKHGKFVPWAREVEVQHHIFLTWELDGGQWSDSCPCCLTKGRPVYRSDTVPVTLHRLRLEGRRFQDSSEPEI